MNIDFCKYLTAILLFGTNGIVASKIMLDSYNIVLLRTFIGSLLLLTIYLLKQNVFNFYRYPRQFCYLCISGVAMGASWLFLYEAYVQIGVSLASLLYYCGPIFVIASSSFIFNEKLPTSKIIAIAIVLLGILLLNENLFYASGNFFGFICGLGSAIMYAFMVIFNKKASSIEGLENCLLQLSISFLTTLLFTFIKKFPTPSLDSTSLLPLLALGLLNTGLGCYLYFSSIKKLSIQRVAIYGYLEPLSAIFFSTIFLKETFTNLQVLGAVFIIGGAIFSELCKLKEE